MPVLLENRLKVLIRSRRLPDVRRVLRRSRRASMRKVLGVVLMGVLVLCAVSAWAGEMEGKIQAVDASDRSIVLSDGTKLSVAEGVSLDMLKEGTDVKVAYEERDGKNVATSIEVK